MTIYWLLFIIPALFAITELPVKVGRRQSLHSPLLWAIAGLVLVLIIGLRHQVGGDWDPYLGQVDYAGQNSLFDTIANQTDPAYAILNWVGANLFGDVYIINLICATVFTYGLMAFCKLQTRPWLALSISVPYIIIVIGMGYTRQSVALGLIMLGIVSLYKNNIMHFIALVVFASMFHKSAVVLALLAIFVMNRSNWVLIPGIILSTFILFTLILKESMDLLLDNYIGGEYSSSGAFVRILMNAFPALIFLLSRKRLSLLLPEAMQQFWTWMSWGALVFVGVLQISPSSTAVDRVALYWFPLQILVWSRLPEFFGRNNMANFTIVSTVLIYNAAILFIWLNYAVNSFSWVPYHFYPFEGW